MNSRLKEINQIISLCDAMITEINKKGIIYAGNAEYEEYKVKIESFLRSNELIRPDCAFFVLLNKMYFKGNYTVNLDEAKAIRSIVIAMKHELLHDSFEKLFISHREKDAKQVAAFMELLYAIGIPRPTVGNDENMIFCTSHPATYIENGNRNLDKINKQFNNSDHTFFILWYTDNYFESQACLNEAGAIWATNKKYQEILAPGFDSKKIGGLMDKQPVWFRANDKFRLNTFKEQIESMFGLAPLTQNAWESARDLFIREIERV